MDETFQEQGIHLRRVAWLKLAYDNFIVRARDLHVCGENNFRIHHGSVFSWVFVREYGFYL
jgi:hypothetical protein